MPIFLFYLLKALKVHWSDNSLLWFATLTAMSIGTATLSWRFLDLPINASKIDFLTQPLALSSCKRKQSKVGGASTRLSWQL